MIPRESEEEQTSEELESEITEVEDIAVLKQTLIEERANAEANLAGWQRAQADFINYKRRTEQEKEEISRFAKATLILELLPVLDDLERAFAAIPPRLAQTSWADGVKLIWGKLRTTLETQGLSEIKAVGEPFDPHLHEAIRQDRGEEGVVVEEVQKGYEFNGRIIRPSKVVVGNGE
ncbi:MAG: nucleotide exchange factor GrpE [Dehalococcoidia bacterium]|nr:MAG: nucleotide exchange factor GrpE [Dehalococcoidia bacterium]